MVSQAHQCQDTHATEPWFWANGGHTLPLLGKACMFCLRCYLSVKWWPTACVLVAQPGKNGKWITFCGASHFFGNVTSL